MPTRHVYRHANPNFPAMRILILSLALLAFSTSPGQTQVQQTTFPFSDGSHPTFMVVFG